MLGGSSKTGRRRCWWAPAGSTERCTGPGWSRWPEVDGPRSPTGPQPALVGSATVKQPDLIPRKVLFGNPTRISPAISPDGRRLAYIAPAAGVLNVWVGALGGDEFQPVTEDRDRGIRFFAWAHDNRHLLHIQDRGGDENWHLYATDVIGGGTRDLTPFESIQARIVGHEKRFPDTLLIGLNRRTPELHD